MTFTSHDLRDQITIATDTSSSAHYAIEVSDDGENWQTEKDEAQGVIDLEGDTPQKVAADMLDDRVTDLRSMGIEPSQMRVAIWASKDAADSGKAPLAVAEHTG